MGVGVFYDRKDRGHMVIMTDNCSELRDALRIVWPESRLLCHFHLMQQIWRWLREKKNSIHKVHRPEILKLVKAIVYATNEEDLPKMLMSNLNNVLDISGSWALAY